MTPEEFKDAYLPLATEVASQTGLNPYLHLTQWALESAWGSSDFAVDCHNLAGLKDQVDGRCGSTVFGSFASYERFGQVYAWEILHAGNPPGNGSYYAGLRNTSGQPIANQFVALGESPWDGDGHYETTGRGPGSSLQLLYDESLRQFAEPSPAPSPVPGPTPGPQPNTSGTYTVQGGDSLSLIALREYGDASREAQLYDDNRLTIERAAQQHGLANSEGGHWIYPGTVLQLRTSHDGPPPAPLPEEKSYTVASGDSLSLIALKVYDDASRWEELYQRNRVTIEGAAVAHGHANSGGGHWIFPGTVLTV